MKENLDPQWLGNEEDEMYRENILDHFRHPHNYGVLERYSIRHKEHNPSCGDNIELFIVLEKNKVREVKFYGKGCAISIASASMLTDKIKSLSVSELKQITKEQVLEMIGIPLGVVRTKCGLLSLNVLEKGIHEMERKNGTHH